METISQIHATSHFKPQVCKTLKDGNWTVEREEDLTGPYGFDDAKYWMAFDDAMSLTIKTKYAILRNLGGVALYSADSDDLDNVCGLGEGSLLKSIFKTMTRLDRRPRQLVVHSLEQDLIAAPQTLSPVGVNVSPYRYVNHSVHFWVYSAISLCSLCLDVVCWKRRQFILFLDMKCHKLDDISRDADAAQKYVMR